uniref:Uncharacterized protein n=1 Tax=Zea mays TaxID=4577 RepID=A0A804UKM0_MAIZE
MQILIEPPSPTPTQASERSTWIYTAAPMQEPKFFRDKRTRVSCQSSHWGGPVCPCPTLLLAPARWGLGASPERVPEDGPVAARLVPAEQGALPGGVPARGHDAVAHPGQRRAEEDERHAEGDPRRHVHLRHRLQVVEHREQPHAQRQRKPHRRAHPPHHPVRHHLRDRRVTLLLLVLIFLLFFFFFFLRRRLLLLLLLLPVAPPPALPRPPDRDDLGLRRGLLVAPAVPVPAGKEWPRAAARSGGGAGSEAEDDGSGAAAEEAGVGTRWGERHLHGKSQITCCENRSSYL